MSSVQPPNPPPEDNNSNANNEEKPEAQASSSAAPENTNGGPEGDMDTTPDQPPEETWEDIPEEIRSLSTDEIVTRTRLIDNDLRVCGFTAHNVRVAEPRVGNPFRDATLAA